MDITFAFFLWGCAGTIATLCTVLGWRAASHRYTRLVTRLAAANGHPVGEAGDELFALGRGPGPDTQQARIDRLESQLDQMSQQVDRMAESQEFLSRVLTDRIDQLPDPRMRTPH